MCFACDTLTSTAQSELYACRIYRRSFSCVAPCHSAERKTINSTKQQTLRNSSPSRPAAHWACTSSGTLYRGAGKNCHDRRSHFIAQHSGRRSPKALSTGQCTGKAGPLEAVLAGIGALVFHLSCSVKASSAARTILGWACTVSAAKAIVQASRVRAAASATAASTAAAVAVVVAIAGSWSVACLAIAVIAASALLVGAPASRHTMALSDHFIPVQPPLQLEASSMSSLGYSCNKVLSLDFGKGHDQAGTSIVLGGIHESREQAHP